MKKIISALLVLLCFSTSYAQINVGVLKGMSAIPFATMLENPDYTFTFYDEPAQLVQDMKNGVIDVTNISSVAAEKLTAKANGNLKVTAVTSTTDFCLVGRRSNVSFSALPGRKIGVAGQGLSKELFTYLLKKNNIPLESGDSGVELIVFEDLSKVTNAYISNKINFAVTSEPATSLLTRNSKRNFVSMDLQQQYKLATGKDASIPMTVVLFRNQILQENQELVTKFNSDLENSLLLASKNPGKIAAIAKKNNLGLYGTVALSAVKYSSFCFIPVKGDFHLIVNQ